MKNKIVIISLVLVGFIIIAASPKRSSSGAPVSSTGAPNETTCAKSGCHDDNSVNSGKATLSLEVGDSIANYIPGKTYLLKIKMAEKAVTRFGFQIVALNHNNVNAGKFQLTDKARTQLISNNLELTDRQYVTYTFGGTDGINGASEWTLNWIAPKTNVGPISFYVAGVSADDDMSDKGDYVYTIQKVLNN
ncbi:MAG: choice-of-anchor V domain-containing protein [Bacteroidia bacterium]